MRLYEFYVQIIIFAYIHTCISSHSYKSVYHVHIIFMLSQHCLSLTLGLLMVMGTGKDWPVPYLVRVPDNMVVVVVVNAAVLVLI